MQLRQQSHPSLTLLSSLRREGNTISDEDAEGRARARYAVVCGSEQVGIAELAASHGEDLAESLRVASTTCTIERLDGKTADGSPRKWSATAECSVEDRPETGGQLEKTPCLYNISIGVAHGIAQDLDLPVRADLERLMDQGYDPEEAESVLAGFVRQVRQHPEADEEATSWSDTFAEVFHLPSTEDTKEER